MEKELLHGSMEDATQVNISMIKSMDMEFLLDLTERNMKGIGLMASKMEKEF